MIKTAADPKDVQELQFKLHCKLKVFENTGNANFSHYCSLVACASRFGLIFLGTNTSSIQVIQLKTIENCMKSDGDNRNYLRRNLSLPSPPIHLSVNCEHSILAIIVEKNGCPCALFYDVKSFWQQDVIQIDEVRLSATPATHVVEVGWNPALGFIFTACKSDGSLGVYELKNPGIDINELPPAAGATCFCWSPKGKQIAVGSRDGKIMQLKPDLKPVKIVNSPSFKEPHALKSLQWVSNYQFIGVFKSSSPQSQAVFIVIDSPKTGDPTFTNYDDICYSNGDTRPAQFYMILLQSWNILMAASSNSMEVGILGNSGEYWTQWILGDAARAELPLSSNHQETLPIGCALDIGNSQPLPWGEVTLPPTPLLLLLSHHGVLCCFNVVYLKEGSPTICTPPDAINNMTGLQHFITGSVEQKILKDSNKPVIEPVLKTPEIPKTVTSSVASPVISIPIFKTPQPQPILKGLNLSQTQPVNLFGGQVTITPTQDSNKPSTLPPQYQSILQNLASNDNKTSAMDTVVPPATAHSLVTSAPSKTPVITTNSSTSITQKPSLPISSEELSKTEVTINMKTKEEAEKIFAQMVSEECLFLESELKAVLYQGKKLKVELGSEEDKTKIIDSTKSLDDFFHEVLEICITQNAEVHILKQNVLQSWAWYEEAKSRHLISEDDSMKILLRAQPLDSASEKQLADIQHTNYYLESQISQAHVALDEQWEHFQDYCKKTHKIQIPTMEMIFQTLVKQNAILRKQSYILKDIAPRIKSKSRSSLGSSLLISVDNTKVLQDELKKLRVDPENICQVQYEHITNRVKNFKREKVDMLRCFLKSRKYPYISAVKPQLSSSIIQTSPSSKYKQYSLLTAKSPEGFSNSPTTKLDLIQSTPKPVVPRIEDKISTQISTPIQGLQNFALKFEAKNFMNPSDLSFTPLSKNLIATPNSAFVSTSFGSNTSTVTATVVTTSSLKPTPMSFTTKISSAPFATSTSSSFTTITSKPQQNQSNVGVSISLGDLSKPFSFTASTPTVSSQDRSTNISKSSATLFASSSTSVKEPLINDVTSTFGTPKTGFPAFNIISSKPSSTTTFSFIPSTKVTTAVPDSSTATKVSSSSNFSFGSLTPSTPSFSISTKPSETTGPVSEVKPFSFSSKSSVLTAASTAQNVVITSVSSSSSSSTNFAFETGSAIAAKTTDSSVFGASKNNFQTVSSTISTTPTSTVTPSSVATSSVPVASTQPSGLLLSGMKPSLFTSAASLTTTTTTASNVASVTTMSSANVPPPVTTSVFAQSTTSIFGSGSTTSSTGISFGTASTSRPLIFGSSDSSGPKVSVSSNVPSVSTTPITTAQTSGFGTTLSTSATGSANNSTATLSSIFGVTSTAAPIFGTTTATSTSIFGAASPTSAPIFEAATSSAPVFGSSTSTSIFEPKNASAGIENSTITSQASIFGTKPSLSTGFGTFTSTTSSSIFGTTTPSTSTIAFGSSSPTATQASVFGASPSSPTTGFGSLNPSTTQTTVFGTSSTSAPSMFGAATTPSVFSSGNASQSVFGNAGTPVTKPSIFGNVTTTSQSQGFGVFGEPSQKSSIFSSVPTSSTQSSIFGSSNQSSVFGNATSTSGSSFGQTQSSSGFGQPPAFGSRGNTFGSTSAFGSSSTFGQPSGSVFGSTPATTSGSIFGATPTTGSSFASSGSVFGTPASNAPSPFGSASVFSSNTTQANTGSFGFGSLNVGSTPTTSSSAFGSSATINPFANTNKSVFGSTAAPSNSSVFGSSNTGSLFGSSTQQTFGSSSFGSPSVFGQQASFGQSTFGSGSFSQSSAGGPFSGSSGSVGQTGFGTNTNFQKPGGFGSSPVFGGSPSFGSQPSFGGAPSFGSSPTFGASQKIFGSGGSGFGAEQTAQNAGFGNLANQPTVGFGNLAQQANTGTSSAGFSGNSSFSSWR